MKRISKPFYLSILSVFILSHIGFSQLQDSSKEKEGAPLQHKNLEHFDLNPTKQNSFQNLPIVLSYYGYNVFHPGMKIGTSFTLNTWKKEKQRSKGIIVKQKNLFLNPQLGAYVHPRIHSGFIVNAEIGVETTKLDRKLYHAHSFGLGYLIQLNSGTTYSFESDGTFTEKRFSTKGYLMTSYNYEVGQQLSPKFTWFGKFSFASKLFYNTGISLSTFLEAGIKYTLKPKVN